MSLFCSWIDSKNMHIFVEFKVYISQVEKVFMKENHRIHGIPEVTVSEKDLKFIGSFLERIMEDEWNNSSYELRISSTNI
jgi:hypothetical protein